MIGINQVFAREKFPHLFLAVFLASLLVQCVPALRGTLIYHRDGSGEIWRIWTCHIVHFGWAHWMADAWLFLLLGRLLEREHPILVRTALLGMPGTIIGTMTLLDPSMDSYGGLSGINVGLLVFITLRNWSRDRFDWFWPAILVIHVLELMLEYYQGGQGGAMIPFDDPTVRVATMAHLGGILYGVGMWSVVRPPQNA